MTEVKISDVKNMMNEWDGPHVMSLVCAFERYLESYKGECINLEILEDFTEAYTQACNKRISATEESDAGYISIEYEAEIRDVGLRILREIKNRYAHS